MFKFKPKYFYIRTPYFSAWQKYNWEKDVWGLGLNKERVDQSVENNKDVLISYGRNKKIYSLSPKKIQKYPIEMTSYNVELYIIPISILKKIDSFRMETIEDSAKMGVF